MALAAGALAATVATPAFAQAPAEEASQLDRVQVTGTRISRSEIETAQPVTVITREDINLSGKLTVADFLQQSPFNTFGSFRETFGFASGASGTHRLLGILGIRCEALELAEPAGVAKGQPRPGLQHPDVVVAAELLAADAIGESALALKPRAFARQAIQVRYVPGQPEHDRVTRYYLGGANARDIDTARCFLDRDFVRARLVRSCRSRRLVPRERQRRAQKASQPQNYAGPVQVIQFHGSPRMNNILNTAIV